MIEFAARIDVYHHIVINNELKQELSIMSKQLDDLTAAVTNSTAVTTSALTLISGLAQKIEALQNDPAKLQALADELRADNAALAKAVTDNTVAVGEPSPPPVEPAPPATPSV